MSWNALLTTATKTNQQGTWSRAPRTSTKSGLGTLLITGVIIFSTTATTQAQSTGRRPLIRGASVNNTVPVSPDQAARGAAVAQIQTSQEYPAAAQVNALDSPEAPKKAIVGSWIGNAGDGSRILASYTSDGIVSGSVQGEVSLIPSVPILSPSHGAWTHLRGREYSVTAIGMFYDGITFEYLATLKVRLLLTLNAAGDQMDGTEKVEIFAPNGELIEAFPLGNVHYTRIKAEPFN